MLKCGFVLAHLRRTNAPLPVCAQLSRNCTTAATFSCQQRRVMTFPAKSSAPAAKQSKVGVRDWNRAISEAERIVGYPTSFLSLRWLLSDEIANVAQHLRKLVGSSHPLLKTAKLLLYNGKNTMQAWGLMVLLVSRAAGHSSSIPDVERDLSAGVLHSQRALAEITEMIRISHLVHNSLVSLQPGTDAHNNLSQNEDIVFGNKITLLTGDYMLGHSSAALANLRNQIVVEMVSSAVRDFTESEFIGDRDEQNNPLPSNPSLLKLSESKDIVDFDLEDVMKPIETSKFMGNPKKEWEIRNLLNVASLLGKSCMAATNLAGLNIDVQHRAYRLGKHIAFAWQSCLDIEPFQSPTLDAAFSLVSAPVLFHLQHNPTLYTEIEKAKEDVENVDFVKIHKAILAGPAVEQSKALQREHTAAALQILQDFPETDARTALENILLAMNDI